MRLVLLGAPGVGKGTQSKILCGRYGIEHISTGDIFRSEMQKGTELGKKAAEYVNKGSLVPDALVVEMVAGRLGGAEGWLLDGFPRTLEQAQALDRVLAGQGRKIDLVLNLVLPEEEIVRRLTGRRVCEKCGAVFNLATRAPRTEGKCDECAGELKQREDDTEATVRRRLMVYEDLTSPLAAYYKAEYAFSEVDGSRSPEEVTEALTARIEPLREAAPEAAREAKS